jgi:DNA-binding ferritin-like protein (Dps family)
MPNKFTIVMAVNGIALLILAGLGLHYRSRAAFYQHEYSVVSEQLSRATAEAVTADEVRTIPVRMNSSTASKVEARPGAETSVVVTGLPVSDTGAPPRPADPERPRRRSFDWMENLKTNDPQRYAEFQQRRQTMQQNMQNAWAQATNYFMNRDTSKMTQSDLGEYSAMIGLLSQAAALNQQLQSGLPPEVRQQVASDLRSNIVAVAPLLENERNREYYDAAVALGHSEQDAATMVSYINQITSNTSLRTIIPGVRMGGGFGGGPGR